MKFKSTIKKESRLLENKRSSFFEDERCRKIMEAFVDKEVELEIQDLTEEEFPIAFVIQIPIGQFIFVVPDTIYIKKIVNIIKHLMEKSGKKQENRITGSLKNVC